MNFHNIFGEKYDHHRRWAIWICMPQCKRFGEATLIQQLFSKRETLGPVLSTQSTLCLHRTLYPKVSISFSGWKCPKDGEIRHVKRKIVKFYEFSNPLIFLEFTIWPGYAFLQDEDDPFKRGFQPQHHDHLYRSWLLSAGDGTLQDVSQHLWPLSISCKIGVFRCDTEKDLQDLPSLGELCVSKHPREAHHPT